MPLVVVQVGGPVACAESFLRGAPNCLPCPSWGPLSGSEHLEVKMVGDVSAASEDSVTGRSRSSELVLTPVISLVVQQDLDTGARADCFST